MPTNYIHDDSVRGNYPNDVWAGENYIHDDNVRGKNTFPRRGTGRV